MSFAGGGAAWRVPLAIQFVFIVILFATVPWLPESPRYYDANFASMPTLVIETD